MGWSRKASSPMQGSFQIGDGLIFMGWMYYFKGQDATTFT